MTIPSRRPPRSFPLLVAAVVCGAALSPTAALAAPRALTLEVLPDTPEIDATALSEAVASELAGPDEEAPAPLKILVSVDHQTHELVVEIRNKGLRISRRVPAPADPAALRRIAVFLIGNLARDQASSLLQGLRPSAEPSAEDPSEPAGDPAPAPVAPPHLAPPPPPEESPRRVWLGVSGEYDFMILKGAGEACLLATSYHCTAGGQDVSGEPDISPTRGDSVEGGLRPGNGRLLLSLDYAATGNVLVGGRVGLVFGGFPAEATKPSGAALGPLHVEARVTYLFGDAPLSHTGLAPYVMAAAGAAEWSAHLSTILDNVNNPATSTRVQAWKVGGPGFASAGGGLRLAVTRSAAVLVGPRFNIAFGAGGALVSMSPEVGVQVGF